MQYLLIAQNIARSGQPYMSLASERYGGDIENMVRLHKPYPQYEYILGYHFPSYPCFLAILLSFTKDSFWAAYLGHTVLFLGVILLTYYFTYHLTSQTALAFLSSLSVCFSPTLSMYLPITMMEIFLVFLLMLSVYLSLRPSTSQNNVILSIALSLLTVSRSSFLVLSLPIFLYRFSRATKSQLLSSALIWVLPLAAHFSLGRQGYLFFHEGHHTGTWSDIVQTTLSNIERIRHFEFSWSGHPLYEFYLYVGIAVLVASLGMFRKKQLYWTIAFTHLSISTATIVRYDWYDWRHIRVAMWFVPFSHILLISLLGLIKPKWIQRIGLLVALLLFCSVCNANWTLLTRTLPESRDSMQQASSDAQQVKEYVDTYHSEARFVLVPNNLAQIALFDPGRIYYTSWPKQIEEAVPRLRQLGFSVDLALVDSDSMRPDLDVIEVLSTTTVVCYACRAEVSNISTGDTPVAHWGQYIQLVNAHSEYLDQAVLTYLAWNVKQPLPDDITIFIHLLSPNGERVAQADGDTINNLVPLGRWHRYPNKVIQEVRTLVLPPEAAPGTYTVIVGLYNRATMERLDVSCDNQRCENRTYILGDVEVQSRM